MKVWIYVEGESDKLGLDALWRNWKIRLRNAGWGIQFIPLGGKPKYLKYIGRLAAEKLTKNETDIVVGLPDLYPNAEYVGTKFQHRQFEDLQRLQHELVGHALSSAGTDARMDRFFAGALKHDLEMLLLAAEQPLKERLRLESRQLGNFSQKPEDQNQSQPPKKIVDTLFRRGLKRAYRETKDAPAILSKSTLEQIVIDERGGIRCPAFKHMVDWVGEKTSVPAY